MTQEELFAQHVNLAHFIADRIAGKYRGRFEDRRDLRQEAAIGLLDAVRRFDPANGAKFATFAAHRIRGRVLDALREMDHLGRRARQEVKNGTRLEPKQLELVQSDLLDEGCREQEIREARDLFAAMCRRMRPAIREVFIHRAHGLKMKQIGLQMGLSESRVSQLASEGEAEARKEFPGEIKGAPSRIEGPL